MRILHTSDWHLGRLFHGASLQTTQEAVCERIVAIADDNDVDVVIIAGDLYDRSFPPTDAVELFDETLLALRATGAVVVAISGNHDSAVRTGYGERLMTGMGVTVRGDHRRVDEPVVVDATDGGAPLAIYPVPYLDPRTVQLHRDNTGEASGQADAGPDADSSDDETTTRRRFGHQDAMDWAVTRIRADVARRDARSVVVAHTFVAGGAESDSERALTIGTIDQVRPDTFAGFDYVALGHLHGRQSFADGRVAYSGTPLHYSFSEEQHTKSVRIVDIAADGTLAVEELELGVGRTLATIEGEFESLLTDERFAHAEDKWVRVRYTDTLPQLQPMEQLRARFPHAVALEHVPAVGASGTASSKMTGAEVRRRSPLELVTQYLEEQRGSAPDDTERELLVAAIEAAERSGDGGGTE